MPVVLGPMETVGTAVVAGSGSTNAPSWVSMGVGGWLATSSGSYSKTSGMVWREGEYSGDRAPKLWLRAGAGGDVDMVVVEGAGRDVRVRGCGRIIS
jgi:hypothetical protein